MCFVLILVQCSNVCVCVCASSDVLVDFGLLGVNDVFLVSSGYEVLSLLNKAETRLHVGLQLLRLSLVWLSETCLSSPQSSVQFCSECSIQTVAAPCRASQPLILLFQPENLSHQEFIFQFWHYNKF